MTYSETHPDPDDRWTASTAQSSTHSQSTTNRAGDVSLRCSLCGRFYERSESSVIPFCSRRCQQIDLGNWLDERYGFPIEGSEDAPPDDSDPDVEQ